MISLGINCRNAVAQKTISFCLAGHAREPRESLVLSFLSECSTSQTKMADVGGDETSARRRTSDQETPETTRPEVPQFRNTTLNNPWNQQTVSSSPSQEPWNVLTYWMLSQYYQQYYYQLCSYVYYWQANSLLHGPFQAQNNAFQASTSPQAGSGVLNQGSQNVYPGQQPVQIQNVINNQQQQQLNGGFLAGIAMPWVPQTQHQLRTVCEVNIASVPRRICAEFIDFVFLFLTKFLVFSIFYDNMERYSQLQYTLITDETASLKDIEELLVQALVYRFMVFAYEVFFLMGGLHGSVGGATPGKYLMGLSVVSAEYIDTLAENPQGTRVRITPGGNLGFGRSFMRALVKNFSMTFLFPVFLTILFFQHNRTIYDVISSSAVVVSESTQRRQQERQRR